MRIGFSSIYAWRPHVEHLHYLANLVRDAGHSTSFLSCDGDLTYCYTKALKPQRRDLLHCLACRAGGIRSYESDGVHAIGSFSKLGLEPAAADWAASSASTLGRFETLEEFHGSDFKAIAAKLAEPTTLTYRAALQWIDREQLDGIFVFNGRMEATRALIEAAAHRGIPFVTVERTWFGDGLQMLPNESCLGLKNIDRMMLAWREQPLTHQQALRAAALVAARFLRRNDKEWRAYNLGATERPWPVEGGSKRLLLLPGSLNEVWGHPDWQLRWSSTVEAFDALIHHLKLHPSDVVLRCHPNWGEKIGGVDGECSERHYTEWAASRGVHCIGSRDATSTQGLIRHCDAIVVCGGSAALEAGMLGKQVIAVSPSIYQRAGFQSDAFDAESLQSLSLHADLPAAERKAEISQLVRRTLRFAYTMNYRVAQFVNQVHCQTTTHYEYRQGADPSRIINMLKSGQLEADDIERAPDDEGEKEVLQRIAKEDWQGILDQKPAVPAMPLRRIERRWLWRPIDQLRNRLPRGDL